MSNKYIIEECQKLLNAYHSGELGQTKMPEDANPGQFNSSELRLSYFTLPMALNYQRDSYKLWEAALKTFNDSYTNDVFDIKKVVAMTTENLQEKLIKYKLALQPNKHINTWQTICRTINEEWGSLENLVHSNDFLEIKDIIQNKFKKGFPYISGPKIFNYWCLIIQQYGGLKLINSEFIEIAPDTHITKCSVKLGVINTQEAVNLTKEQISERWRLVLKDSGINPIDMHSPLWFWSRNGFKYCLEK
jgi:hypothetical protein